jgi:nucleotide-binding universal stress UspA family protein
MLKRILVLLGETPSSEAARAYAFHLAKDSGAALTGLAGVDLSALHAPNFGRTGANAFGRKLETDLRAEAGASEKRLHTTYESACAAEGLDFEWLAFEGDSLEALTQAAETRDLLVTGYDTAFQGGKLASPLPDMLARLLARAPRPVLVCGEEVAHEGPILVAYDGSLPAMRTLQMFALLGAWAGRPVHVVSVAPKHEQAERMAAGAGSYLRSHGYQVTESPLATRVDPPEVLHMHATAIRAGTLVMGSYGHAGLRETLFGSSTNKLVEDPPCALFVYH